MRPGAPATTQNAGTTKTQVNSIALQTDLCDTLYITKNMLVAYTIAVVQNTQTIQYEQMHVALQTAQNQASLEMPLQAEQLMTTHFNLAVLSSEASTNNTLDAKKPETTPADAALSTSTADDEETYVKISSQHISANRNTKRVQPTRTVSPTCRGDYGLVNGIPAGYESDDSWDQNSLTHETEHVHNHNHTHNIVLLLALRTCTNCQVRGRGQPSRQNNNINVRSGNAPYSRPWESQPYGRRTRSQQALHARAYRSGNASTKYHGLLHRCCASLDLETAFKQIKISQDIQPDLCKECQTEKCRCPAFMPGTPCSSASSTPMQTNSDQEDILELVDDKQVHVLYPPKQMPSDEEADREVATICQAPVYYQVRSQLMHRWRYYMYNTLDLIEETCREKRRCEYSPRVQGPPVEY